MGRKDSGTVLSIVAYDMLKSSVSMSPSLMLFPGVPINPE